MKGQRQFESWKPWSLALGMALFGVGPVNAQPGFFPLRDQQPTIASPALTLCSAVAMADLLKQPITGLELATAIGVPPIGIDPAPAPTSARIRMFRMTPGFITNMPALDLGDDSDPLADDIGSRVQVAFGDYNPYFDLRQPRDLGGNGYLQVFSQVQLLELGTTSVCFGLQALTPAGQESGGLNEGGRLLTPGLGIFHDVGDGLALHGYVGQNIASQVRPNETRPPSTHCGMAVQYPVPGVPVTNDSGCFFFMQALGRVNTEGHGAVNWGLVPGVHWRLSDSCWMSLGASRYSLFTCSWQY